MVLSHIFFFNDTATTEIYTLSLHDALPISCARGVRVEGPRHRADGPVRIVPPAIGARADDVHRVHEQTRSEEHTSELQSRQYLVCRLLLEKKKSRSSIPRQLRPARDKAGQ